MASSRDVVLGAVERWIRKGLVDAELGRALALEVEEASRRERTRWSQLILATTGAVVLITAAGVFLGWAWPALGVPTRVVVLVAVGIGMQLLGMRLEHRARWVVPSYLMQTGGLLIILLAVAYSEEAWPNASAGAVAISVVGLALPMVTAWLSVRRNPVMPAVHAALGYAFLALFLSRSADLDADAVVWVLDAVLLASVLVLLWKVRRDGGEGPSDWALNAFVASVYTGMVLAALTALGPLDMDDQAVFALDLWWVVAAALTLWGLHRAPPALQRSWYETQLGFVILLGTAFTLHTLSSALDLSDVLTAAGVGAFGAVWLAYGLPRRSRPVVVTSCLALVLAAWYLGVQTSGALGAVLALAFTGGLLFWVSGRVGTEEA